MDVYFPKKSHHGYYDKALGRTFYSKREKEAHMKKNGLVEDGSMESDRRRKKRLVEQINEDRRKQGLKTKTETELVGDSRNTKEWRMR